MKPGNQDPAWSRNHGVLFADSGVMVPKPTNLVELGTGGTLVDISEPEEDDDWMESEMKRRGHLPKRCGEPQWMYDPLFKPQPDFVPNPSVSQETTEKIESFTLDDEEDAKTYEECKICLRAGEHSSVFCPYLISVPEGVTTLGPLASLACSNCNVLKDHHDDAICRSFKGRAIYKYCYYCGKYGDHWAKTCEEKKLGKAGKEPFFSVPSIIVETVTFNS